MPKLFVVRRYFLSDHFISSLFEQLPFASFDAYELDHQFLLDPMDSQKSEQKIWAPKYVLKPGHVQVIWTLFCFS